MQIDESIEAEFLASILQGKGVVDSDVLKRVEPGYFTVDSYQWLVKALKKREWKPVPAAYLDQELLSVGDDQTRAQYKTQLTRLYSMELSFVEDASKKFRDYVAYCITHSTMRMSMESYSRSSRVDLLLSDLSEGLVSAKEVIEEGAIKPLDYADRYDQRQVVRRSLRDNPSMNPRILTGIAGLDEQFRIKAPMLVDFLAPFKRYKSIFLNAIGYAALLQGFNVFHVTYENSIELTEDRYDSMFSELNYDRVSNLLITPEEKEMMDRMFEWMRSWGNRLKIIKCSPKTTTVKEVEDKLERIIDKEGFVPDIEIWDYLNLICPSRRYREERLEQGQTVWDLKNHADKFNVPIIEASQAKMEGLQSERLEMYHRGKSIDISQGIDLSIAIDQTAKEKDDGIIVLSPHFIRGGEITIPEIILDSDLSRMCIDRSLHRLWDKAAALHSYTENMSM